MPGFVNDDRSNKQRTKDELLAKHETRNGVWYKGIFYPKPPISPTPPPKK